MKLSEIVDHWQGHQIPLRDAYQQHGDVPLYSGGGIVVAHISESLNFSDQEFVLAYPTKGNLDGDVFVLKKPFNCNNMALISVKKEFRDKISDDQLKVLLRNILKKANTNIVGLAYINKKIVLEQEIDLDDPLINDFFKVQDKKMKLEDSLIKIKAALKLIGRIKFDGSEKIDVNKKFKFIGRNDYLSEKGIYDSRNFYNHNNETIKILSGSATLKMYGEIEEHIGRDLGIHYSKQSEIIKVVTRGGAGNCFYLPKGNWATSTAANIMEPINLETNEIKAYAFVLPNLFKSESSGGDRGVLGLSVLFKEGYKIPKLNNDEIKKLAYIYDKKHFLELTKEAIISTLEKARI